MTPEPAALHLLCVAPSRARGEALGALARVLEPATQVSHVTRPAVPSGGATPDVALVDGARSDEERDAGGQTGADGVPTAFECVRRLRASGFIGPIIALSDPAAPADSTDFAAEFARLGATHVSESRLPAVLAAAFVAALEPRAADASASRLLTVLRRTRQLLSAGEIALGLQHSMNNPLAAILAESQLLEMDTLSGEQREAVGRIVALCRRMTAVVRRLDGVGGALGGAASPPSEP